MEENIEPIFLELSCDCAISAALIKGRVRLAKIKKQLGDIDFIAAYDICREIIRLLVEEGRALEALEAIETFEAVLYRRGDESGKLADLHAGILQIKTGLLIYLGETDKALATASSCLNMLAQDVKRRDEPFLSVLAALLYDIARLNISRGKYRQAEREIEKSAKIYERLARISPNRYGQAHILAVSAATKANMSKVKQAEMLAALHQASDVYLQAMNNGVENAAVKLVESLEQEGRTLMQMGKEREAVQYFTRALKYLSKIEPELTEHQLELSMQLGQALLRVKGSKDKGIHLLNTLLHKASRLKADEIHKKIVDILYNAGNHGSDILAFWHKIFPR